MVSLIFQKESFFSFIKHCHFWKQGRPTAEFAKMIQYIRTIAVFVIYKNILQTLSNNHAYLYDYSIFINFRTLRKSKMFWINNLCMLMYAIGLLIIIYQFILVKIKLNVFFSVSELNITCNWSHNLKTIDEFVLVSHLARIERNKKRYVSSCVSFHIYLGSRSTPSLHGYTVINKEV